MLDAGAIDPRLQGAMADVDAEYKDIDTSTNVNGESKTVVGVQAKFLRLRVNSSTVGSGSVGSLGQYEITPASHHTPVN